MRTAGCQSHLRYPPPFLPTRRPPVAALSPFSPPFHPSRQSPSATESSTPQISIHLFAFPSSSVIFPFHTLCPQACSSSHRLDGWERGRLRRLVCPSHETRSWRDFCWNLGRTFKISSTKRYSALASKIGLSSAESSIITVGLKGRRPQLAADKSFVWQ